MVQLFDPIHMYYWRDYVQLFDPIHMYYWRDYGVAVEGSRLTEGGGRDHNEVRTSPAQLVEMREKHYRLNRLTQTLRWGEKERGRERKWEQERRGGGKPTAGFLASSISLTISSARMPFRF